MCTRAWTRLSGRGFRSRGVACARARPRSGRPTDWATRVTAPTYIPRRASSTTRSRRTWWSASWKPYGIDIAILTGNAGLLGVSSHPNSTFGVNFSQAYNDWLIEEWLGHDPRLKGSMVIAPLDVRASVAEIERVGGHPEIVQVIMPSNSNRLYGDRYFWPITPPRPTRACRSPYTHRAGPWSLPARPAGPPPTWKRTPCWPPST